ncbi:3-hydroxyisobutyrate dehydrogenase [Cytobacillus firmus]|uniref:3-hydroxyisobutyrate dehydrogenase n=2 Tax=Cytobacillus TaxID=2675230 RepID=A0A366JTX1_CYTFI|nr:MULTISPECIES: NAD(P)-dependent oxidoreductase [Cytobacillus]RBP90604.1 3-hydroxyisobutyrate dehydrogenase [Cytobacillus firmus]TDX46186.1 3-hydroxyisobutyrate dehydrogenase [Cytobacillus oceanisediminis]
MKENIGFVGLGKMGLPMAMNLLKNGYHVFGSDVNENALIELQALGGNTGSMKDWIHKVQYVVLMLPSSVIVNKVVEEIIDSRSSVSLQDQNSLIIVDMSSSYPADTKENSRKLEPYNISFVDAPVSGGVKKAVDGTLTIMAGGSAEQFEKCKRLLHAVGSNISLVGPSGSGHLIKAINNYLSATHLLASCEAVQLLENFGVQPDKAIDVINQSTGRSGSTEYKFPSFILTEAYNSGFSLELIKKDIGMASQLFKDAGAATSLPEIVYQKFSEASNALDKEADHTEINKFVSNYLLKRGIINEDNEEVVSGGSGTGNNVRPGGVRQF